MSVPPEIPDDLARRAIAVSRGGAPEVAWTAEDAVAVLDSLHGTLLAVLGGDVFVRQSWGFAPTTESWTCERAVAESASDYAVRSRAWTRDWVLDYDGPREDAVFALYFDDQQEAA